MNKYIPYIFNTKTMPARSSKKKNLGQFMTTNYEYILQNMFIPDHTQTIIEPFCGRGDMLKFIKNDSINIERYDIDPQSDNISKKDSLLDPPIYSNKFVLTNPPYLARNKATNKEPFDFYQTNDLYKCFLISIFKDQPDGGIIIIPLNFLSSIRLADIQLRKTFLYKFEILHINIFEEQVFDDTTYTTCAIQFQKHDEFIDKKIPITTYPSKTTFEINLNQHNNFMPGGEIYKLNENSSYEITRLTSQNRGLSHTNILIKCIDDNELNQLGLSLVDKDKIYIDETPNLSARTYATLVITPAISLDKQSELVKRFNEYLSTKRKLYNSLFLTNYRESKDIARKRISFGLVYSICGEMLRMIDDENIDILTDKIKTLKM